MSLDHTVHHQYLDKKKYWIKKKKTSIGYEFMQSAKRYLILQTKFHLHQYS